MKIHRLFSGRGLLPGRRLPAFAGLLLSPFLFFLLAPGSAGASNPVERTLTGCVVARTFYGVYPAQNGVKPVRAYRISVPDSMNLSHYEGKTISIKGLLAPGDRFYAQEGTLPLVVKETCSADYRKVIDREVGIACSVGALKAADKKDFKEADRLIAKALEIDGNDCQTYVERAYIQYARGAFDAGRQDVKRILDRQCPNRNRLNFLILGDVAKILLRAGKKQEAEEIYRLALDTCQSNICRDSVQSDLNRLKTPAK